MWKSFMKEDHGIDVYSTERLQHKSYLKLTKTDKGVRAEFKFQQRGCGNFVLGGWHISMYANCQCTPFVKTKIEQLSLKKADVAGGLRDCDRRRRAQKSDDRRRKREEGLLMESRGGRGKGKARARARKRHVKRGRERKRKPRVRRKRPRGPRRKKRRNMHRRRPIRRNRNRGTRQSRPKRRFRRGRRRKRRMGRRACWCPSSGVAV